MDTQQLAEKVLRESFRDSHPVSQSYCCKEPGQCECSGSSCWKCVKENPEAAENLISVGADRITAGLGSCPVKSEIGKYIDHTLLKPEATVAEITKLCEEARQFGFASVCVNPYYVSLCRRLLRGSRVMVATVVGFPLGADSPEVKAFETRKAIEDGAQEIDMVMNIGALKSGDYNLVAQDIKGVVRSASGNTVKVILETCLLTDEEKIKACLLAKESRANFVKTSTGFSKGGATVKDIALMRKIVGAKMGVKASGGVRTYEDACKMMASGASRIGASASVAIVGGTQAKAGGY